MTAELTYRKVRLPVEQLDEVRVPLMHRCLGVDTYIGNALALETVSQYLRNFDNARSKGTGIIFTGREQSQKTFLACYALRMLMLQDYSCFYATHREFTDALMGGDKRKKEAPFEFDFPARQILRRIQILVIDPIVSASLNDGLKSILAEIVQIRNTEGLPTFYVMTMPMDKSANGFEKNYGRVLYDNLRKHNLIVECSVATQKEERQIASRQKQVLSL